MVSTIWLERTINPTVYMAEMKCGMCNKKNLERHETLVEMDAENQRMVIYYTCPCCQSIYNCEGNLIIYGPDVVQQHFPQSPVDSPTR